MLTSARLLQSGALSIARRSHLFHDAYLITCHLTTAATARQRGPSLSTNALRFTPVPHYAPDVILARATSLLQVERLRSEAVGPQVLREEVSRIFSAFLASSISEEEAVRRMVELGCEIQMVDRSELTAQMHPAADASDASAIFKVWQPCWHLPRCQCMMIMFWVTTVQSTSRGLFVAGYPSGVQQICSTLACACTSDSREGASLQAAHTRIDLPPSRQRSCATKVHSTCCCLTPQTQLMLDKPQHPPVPEP